MRARSVFYDTIIEHQDYCLTELGGGCNCGADIRRCSKGHRIHPEDISKSGQRILPCGCPQTSNKGRQAEGLPNK